MSATETQDWTDRHDPQENAETLGTMVKCALIESASYLAALKRIAESLNNGSPEEIERARVAANNALVGAGVVGTGSTVFTDFKMAWYEAIPRRSPGGGQSYG